MKKINAIIIEDEPKLQKVLALKLEKFCPSVKVVGAASNINEAFSMIRDSKPELVFLDISMPGGSGFDLLQKFEAINFEIIFVTGYDNYLLNAIKISAVDYLLKPLSTEDLITAVHKAEVRIEDRAKIKMYEVLQHNLNHVGEQDTKVVIPGAQTYDFIKIKDIIRCEGWQKYTKIHLVNQSCIVSSYSIGVFKEMLGSYGFFNTHKSHLINTKLIKQYLKEGTVIMEDGSKVPIARRKKEEFMEKVIK